MMPNARKVQATTMSPLAVGKTPSFVGTKAWVTVATTSSVAKTPGHKPPIHADKPTAKQKKKIRVASVYKGLEGGLKEGT